MSIARHFVLLAGRRPAELLFQPSKSTTGRRMIASTLFAHQGPSSPSSSSSSIHTSATRCESELGKLRKKTGYAFALCRKALEMHQQDLAKAEKWLRAEALKQGWEKAERVKSRSTGEGLVGIYTSPDRRTAAMVEVRCETDFVARNEHFVGLVTALAERLSNFSSGAARDARDRGSCIHKRWIVDEGKLVELAGSSITEAISKLGENIRFVRGCIVHIQGEEEDPQQEKATSASASALNQVRLLPYTHAVAGKVASANPNVILGKYGTIIAIQKQQNLQSNQTVDAETEQSQVEDGLKSNSIEEVGSKLGQHIIGLTPLTVTPPPPPPTSSESSASFEEATEEEITGEEEPTALLKQKFIFNDEITVEQFLANSNAAVLDFVRFECGEEGADS